MKNFLYACCLLLVACTAPNEVPAGWQPPLHGYGSDVPPTVPDAGPSDGPDNRRVDMIYDVDFEKQKDDDCGDDRGPYNWPMSLDAVKRNDGDYDLTFHGSYLPEGDRFEKASRSYQSDVYYDEPRTLPGRPATELFDRKISGKIERGQVNLIVTEDDLRLVAGQGRVRCTRRVRVHGTPRPMLDPAELTGHYKLRFVDQVSDGDGRYCDQSKRSALKQRIDRALDRQLIDLREDLGLSDALADEAAAQSGKRASEQNPVRLRYGLWEVTRSGNKLYFTSAGGTLQFKTKLPDATGRLEWQGDMYFLDRAGGSIQIFEGAVLARAFGPDRVDLTFEFHQLGDSPQCGYRFEVEGWKLIHDLDRDEGTYRPEIWMEDSLFGGHSWRLSTAPLRLIEQDDGLDLVMLGAYVFSPNDFRYAFNKHDWYRVGLTLDGNTFRARLGSNEEGEKVVIEGTRLENGQISVVVSHSTLIDYPDVWREYTFDAQGGLRFVFPEDFGP